MSPIRTPWRNFHELYVSSIEGEPPPPSADSLSLPSSRLGNSALTSAAEDLLSCLPPWLSANLALAWSSLTRNVLILPHSMAQASSRGAGGGTDLSLAFLSLGMHAEIRSVAEDLENLAIAFAAEDLLLLLALSSAFPPSCTTVTFLLQARPSSSPARPDRGCWGSLRCSAAALRPAHCRSWRRSGGPARELERLPGTVASPQLTDVPPLFCAFTSAPASMRRRMQSM